MPIGHQRPQSSNGVLLLTASQEVVVATEKGDN